MDDNYTSLIGGINNDRKLEARCIKFRNDVIPLLREIKTLYDVAMDEGFNDDEAMVFSNTYFSAVLASNINI
jgi:hypothetical protein